MAASTVSSPSSLLHTKHSITTLLPLPTRQLTKPFKPLKLLKLYIQFRNPLSLSSSSRFCPSFSAFDSTEVSQDDRQSETEEYEQELKEEEQEEEGEGEEEELKPSESNEEGRLFVGNLPYSMTSSQLTEVFQEAGQVVNVQIIYDRVTDRSRGFGFVTMASVEDAKEAIRMFNGSQIGGRTVKVNIPEVPKGGEREVMGPRIRSTYKGFIDSPHKIYAGNLGWGLTSQGLRDAFASQPGFLSAKVIYERDTGRSRGFGFISFESAENAEAALNAMNGVEVEGRPLRLNLAAERARSPPSMETNSEDNLESSELVSSIGS
ncbi:hypothetical protein JCGZ_08743 [Jatropha curcas]|uniref:RRM domain-containing protein n=1 Tax=Jatropha curcas TaxID=180498 RepID=A0A067KW74_JATCU|nr:RNA-binding protein CP33, chloroplastic [Jatropha curcas]KDP36099.1 hypothetical protein JCGZ_08743 [Jatropha curcas]